MAENGIITFNQWGVTFCPALRTAFKALGSPLNEGRD